MADRKETPDVMSSLLGEKTEPRQHDSTPEQQPSGSPATQTSGTPEHHNASMPASQQDQPPASVEPVERTKATYYIANRSLEELEQAWFSLRQSVSVDERGQISKSRIVETALDMALSELREDGTDSRLAARLMNQ